MDGYVISTERVIPADASAIFGYLDDASKHPLIDGSGSLRGAKPGAPDRLVLGSVFGMSMQLGVKYSMVNTVVEYEENRRIAWQARPKGFMGKIAAGRIWRYVLEPTNGGTKVTESWDISQDKQRALLRLGPVPEQTRKAMAKTLERIEELTTT